MKTIKFILIMILALTMASCTLEEFVGIASMFTPESELEELPAKVAAPQIIQMADIDEAVQWVDFLQYEVIPVVIYIVSALGTAGVGLLLAFKSTKAKVDSALTNVSETQATSAKTVTETSGYVKLTVAQYETLTKRIDSLEEKVEVNTNLHTHLVNGIDATLEIVKIGFMNNPELVRNGFATLIGKVGAANETETDAVEAR